MLWYVVKIGKRGDFAMSTEKVELSESQKRRKRIDLYKKIIITTIFVLIILPTILCIMLFCKFNNVNKEIAELRKEVSGIDKLIQIDENNKDSTVEPEKDKEVEPEKETETIKEKEPEKAETGAANADTVKKSEKELVEEALKEGRKVVYLTYDDGPSCNTGKLLDVLKKYGVKVTFFLIKTPEYEEYVKRLVEEGHTLAMHTETHDYEHVYRSLQTFKEEVDGIRTYLKNATGVKPFVFRFPGGSSNTTTKVPISTYIDYLDSQKIVYYDWNVSSGDGSSGELTVEEIYNNVIKGVEANDVSVVLMHDSEYKGTTLKATPLIIEKLQGMDALILPITADTVPIHHNIN